MSVGGWIGSVALIVVVSLGALATIRDKIIEGGWDRPRWLLRPLQQSAQHAAARRVLRDAALLGSEFFEHHGNAVDVAVSRKRLSDSSMSQRPDDHLLRELKRWTIRLPSGTDFRGLDHYIDTMGAVCHGEDDETRFAAITHAWINRLQAANAIASFDCLLALKEGNPILVHNVGRRLLRSQDRPVRTVFCKGPRDPAKVSVGAHETDFEGLRWFRIDRPIPRHSDGRYRALALDDNCTSGVSLLEAINHFNEFVSAHPQEYPFAPVDTAVVLFVVKANRPNVLLESDQITLHAVLALGNEDMRRLLTMKDRNSYQMVGSFKDHESCSFSRTLSEKWSTR